MNTRVFLPIVFHELKLLARNTIMWFRFGIFYLVFCAAMSRDVSLADWDRFSLTLVGLMALAAVGVASALSSQAFAQEKERGTMEALLLAPTSAKHLIRAKMFYVASAAMSCVFICLLSGALLVIALGDSTSVGHALNRSTIMMALVASPPAVVFATSIGTLVSCHVSNLQHASAAATLSSIGGMVIVVVAAYLLSTGQALIIGLVAVTSWVLALLAYRTAVATANPAVMIRTRGR